MPALIHSVLFKLNDTFDVSEAAGLIATMKANIPGLLSLEFGPQEPNLFEGYPDHTDGYTHALVSTHTDGAALKVYHEHPDHLALVKYCMPRVLGPVTMVDFYSRV